MIKRRWRGRRLDSARGVMVRRWQALGPEIVDHPQFTRLLVAAEALRRLRAKDDPASVLRETLPLLDSSDGLLH